MDIVFPADYFKPKQPDTEFAEQAKAFVTAGHSVHVWPLPVETSFSELVLYRGWMLNAEEYSEFAQTIAEAGGELVTSPQQYLSAHHLPNWAELLTDLTPETYCWPAEALKDIGRLKAEIAALNWEEYFVKDYVKSLKTGRGSYLRDLDELGELLSDMQRFRGRIEGGLCVRRVESFLPETEQRFFVWRGKPFAPASLEVPELVHDVMRRVQLPFFSVDVVKTQSGGARVVEIGDGQVSDTVGWSNEDFVRIFD